jgi:hypothetical protein
VLEQSDFESEATAAEFARFMESTVWRDLEAVLFGQIAVAQAKINMEDELKEVFRGQGMIEALNVMLSLPAVIYDELQQKQEGEKDGEGSGA